MASSGGAGLLGAKPRGPVVPRPRPTGGAGISPPRPLRWQSTPGFGDTHLGGGSTQWNVNPGAGDTHLGGGNVAPKLPTAPTAAATAPTNSATTETSPQLDSTALSNIAQHLFQVNNQIGGLTARQGYASTNLQNALAQLAYQQPRDQLRAEQAANSRGGLYSTVYNQQLGNLTHGYQEKQGAAQQGYQRTADSLAAQIAALQQGIPLFNEGQAEASAGRAAALAAQAPPDLSAPAPAGAAPGAGLAAALAQWQGPPAHPEHIPAPVKWRPPPKQSEHIAPKGRPSSGGAGLWK